MKIIVIASWIIASILLSGCMSSNSAERANKSKECTLLDSDTSQVQSWIWVKGAVQNGAQKLRWRNGMTAWDAVQEAGGITRFAADVVMSIGMVILLPIKLCTGLA